MKKEEFIQKIAGYVKKYAAAYEIKVCSPIIAQAILESGWGESKLAKVYHNVGRNGRGSPSIWQPGRNTKPERQP